MRLTGAIATAMLAQRGRLLCWAPVCLAAGIGIYFALPVEPGPGVRLALCTAALGATLLTRRAGAIAGPALLALALIAAGVSLTGQRAAWLAEPVLGFRYYGPVQGRVVHIDRSASDAVRLTLDRVVLERMDPARTPVRVRVSLHGPQDWLAPEPGMTVILTGHLSPPAGPVEPGGYDFRRAAWFDRLGAVGYTRTPVLLLLEAEDGALPVARLRHALSAAIRARLPGEPGSFAAAILTGDRSGMSLVTLGALRDANLAHLLAISGLHMGLLTGFVFAALRFAAALAPPLALRWPVKKIAAGAALLSGAAYLALSGGAVATERAFVMVGVMLCAVLLDRRAITLRAVALAALIVLLRRPEELTGPGFQMSFAATVALVAVFRALRGVPLGPRWTRAVAAVVISSAVAGFATAPFAAAHFNRVAHFGLAANLLSVPVMGTLVMPAAVVAGLLAPVGLAAPALWVMETGLGWILLVAARVSDLPGAVGHVVAPPGAVLPLLAIGGLWITLWQGRARWAGILAVGVAGALWARADRPDLLVADSGGLVGVLRAEGRALSKPTGDGFSASVWLENDGAAVDQATAHAQGRFARGTPAPLGPVTILHVTGTRALAAVPDCAGAQILVSNVPGAGQGDWPCTVLDPLTLRLSGSIAGRLSEGTLTLDTVAGRSGDRPWAPARQGATALQGRSFGAQMAEGPSARAAQ